MTRFLLLSCAMLLPLSANAQLVEANDRFETGGEYELRDGDAVSLTHSNVMEVGPGGVACFYEGQTGTAENNFFRVFDIADHGVEGELEISSIAHGVGANQAFNDQFFFFYLVDGELLWDNMDLLASVPFSVDVDDQGQIINVDFDDTVTVPAGSRLAVQVHIPDSDNQYNAYPGFNQKGQTGPTYAYCGAMEEPTDLATLGFEHAWVMAVIGKDVVVSGEEGATARTVVLGDAYPNPMAGQATLPITLQEATHVRISIHDVLGREVTVVSDNMMQAGSQMINVSTDGLAAGTYIVRMVAGTEILSNRIVVVR